MEKTSLYAYIAMKSEEFTDFPPEIITERLGIQPTRTWKLGDRVYLNKPNNLLERTYTCWKFKTDKMETLDIEDVLRPILEVFESKAEIINELKIDFNCEVSLSVVTEVYNGEMPALVIRPEFSRFLATMNAGLEFDTYVIS